MSPVSADVAALSDIVMSQSYDPFMCRVICSSGVYPDSFKSSRFMLERPELETIFLSASYAGMKLFYPGPTPSMRTSRTYLNCEEADQASVCL